MERSESEAIFDSLNLKPQLFINAALNIVDELIDSAFDHLHQEASIQLKVDGSDMAEDLTKGLDYIRNTIQSSIDKRLTMWEKYCFLRLFVVPEGFSLPKDDEESGSDVNVMDVDAVSNPDLDAHLDSLRTKLNLLQKLAIELRTKVEKLKTEKEDESEHQKVRLWNEDLLRIIGGNGVSNTNSEEIEGFLQGFNT
ncbi:hypothetical protein Lser_V15G18584 [Lactuca serriola]